MGIHPNEISTDALLEQAGWLSVLARRLVRDPTEAEDVAQETMLAALSSGDPAPRRWLAHVARNIARARARSQSARAQRESARGAPPPAPSSSDLAEKLEAQRLLVEAVRDLDEPYRTTILLHYWEHQTSEEIAAIQGVAAGTVRWRLKQAVDVLRQRLDGRHGGDRRAWSALLVPLVDPAGNVAMATTSVFTGIIGMKLLLQATVAIVLLAVGAGVWLTRTHSDHPAVPEIQNERALVQLDETAPPSSHVPELDETRPVARTPAPTPEPGPKPVEPVISARVEARILDELARPIAGARMSVTSATDVSAIADAEGRLAFAVTIFPANSPVDFRVSATARASRILSAKLQAGETTYLGDVVLQPGGSVSGRILDAQDRPVAGATVGLESVDIPQAELSARAESRFVGEPRTSSRIDGSYRIEGAPTVARRVVAFSPSHQTGYSAIVEVRAGAETSGVDVELPPLSGDRTVRGIVLDPDDQPVAYARIHFNYSQSTTFSSGTFDADKDGRFFEVVTPGTNVRLFAHDAMGRWSDASAPDVRPSDKDIVLRFRTAQWTEAHVTGPDGTNVESFTGRLWSQDHHETLTNDFESDHPAGLVKLQVPSVPFLLDVQARGFADAVIGPLEPASVGARVEVVLKRVHGISGRVVTVDGPVAHAQVKLFGEAAGRIEANGFLVNVDPNARDRVETSSDGSFFLAPQGVGAWVVRADVEGFAPTERRLQGYDAERGASGVELVVTAGGTIAGHVLPRSGHEPVGTIVAVSRGDGFARTLRVGPDGAFSFDHLTPGRWMVARRSEEVDPHSMSMTWKGQGSVELPWNCEVFEGRTTRFDLGVDANSVCTLNGKLKVKGADVGTWNATFANEPGAPKIVMLDQAGSFQLERAEAGDASVLLTAITGPFEGTRILLSIALGVGDNAWSGDIVAATLRLRGAGSGSSEPLVFVVVRDDSSYCVRLLPETGDVDIVVPSGSGRVMVLDPQAMKGVDPRLWTGGSACMLQAGETTTVERP